MGSIERNVNIITINQDVRVNVTSVAVTDIWQHYNKLICKIYNPRPLCGTLANLVICKWHPLWQLTCLHLDR